MPTDNQYAQRDIVQLDEDGDYYTRHVSAMTAEGLHAKSDIAAELGWRDREIARLREALAAAQTLSEIYFSIAEQFVDSDTIRQRRDVQIARAALENGDE